MSGAPYSPYFCFFAVFLEVKQYCRERGYPVEFLYRQSGNHIFREILPEDREDTIPFERQDNTPVDCDGLPISLPSDWEEEMSNQPPQPDEYEDHHQEEPDPAAIIADAGYDPLEHLWPCKDCCVGPCLWKANKAELRQMQRRILVGFPYYENNEIRKAMYREAAFVVFGFLGKNQRRELPACVVQGIRSLCPSPSYMGFMPE
jgi:hypothetical protein